MNKSNHAIVSMKQVNMYIASQMTSVKLCAGNYY